MNQGKTLVTKSCEGPAFFLGTEITWRAPQQKKVILSSRGRKVRITGRLSLHAPMKKLSKKLVERKFAKWDLSGKTLTPVGLKRLQNMSHSDIISYYNVVTRGILNYYSFADNRSSLGSVVRILRMSCARTLALKYKLRYMSKAYKKFGSSLECPDTKAKIYRPTTLKRIRQFNTSSPKTLEALEKSWASKLTKSNLGESSIICGGIPAQMHHVRKIKELKSRKHLDWFTMQMAAIQRKQVPLCANHHSALHANKLTPLERELFSAGCKPNQLA